MIQLVLLLVNKKRRSARPETRQRHRPTTKTRHHKSTADAATHVVRVPFQRRHAFPSCFQLEAHLLPWPCIFWARDLHAFAIGSQGKCLARSDSLQETDFYDQESHRQSTCGTCTSNICFCPATFSHTLISPNEPPDTTRRPSGNTATHQTYDEDTS